MSQQFFPALHAFRAFAIVNIVAIHAFGFIFELADTAENAPTDALRLLHWTNGNLFHDSTLYFTFISGMLFALILAERGYSKFYSSKIRNILLPYIFFTVIFTWRKWNYDGSLTVFDGTFLEFTGEVAGSLFAGDALFSFWYIPILIFLYLATPILHKLLSLEKARGLNIVIMLSPLVLSRVFPEFSWTTLMYFLGAYMLGMLVGSNYQKTLEIIERHLYLIVSIAILSTVAVQYLISIDSPTWGDISLPESAWYIQKIAFSAIALFAFERTIKRVPKSVDVVANYSFSIYFIHGYLLFDLHRLLKDTGIQLDNVPLILALALLNLVAGIVLCVLITHVVQRVLGRWSRSVIGS